MENYKIDKSMVDASTSFTASLRSSSVLRTYEDSSNFVNLPEVVEASPPSVNNSTETTVLPNFSGDSVTFEVSSEEAFSPLPSIFAKGTEPLNDWICPISFKLMVDPVVAQDGHSYERLELFFELLTNTIYLIIYKNTIKITRKYLYKGIIQLYIVM